MWSCWQAKCFFGPPFLKTRRVVVAQEKCYSFKPERGHLINWIRVELALSLPFLLLMGFDFLRYHRLSLPGILKLTVESV